MIDPKSQPNNLAIAAAMVDVQIEAEQGGDRAKCDRELHELAAMAGEGGGDGDEVVDADESTRLSLIDDDVADEIRREAERLYPTDG